MPGKSGPEGPPGNFITVSSLSFIIIHHLFLSILIKGPVGEKGDIGPRGIQGESGFPGRFTLHASSKILT
jgi:hypothetical protein